MNTFNGNAKFMLYPRRRKKNVQVSLKLTSMIDMFTILLVFLLKSFSAEGQIVTVSQDLRLPESTAQKSPEPASTIAITEEWVLLDGEQVAPVNEVMSLNKLMIPGLADGLNNLKTVSETVGQMSGEMGFTGQISIQGDKEIPYQLLKKVMFTCGQIGYNDILLTVTKIE
ncbi:MAG: biopolymer transporter ExbD [candidate division KSB1 bacterium]|jgi:biopolymer transport protein ExbD|nr:biopolymer transporter ExbD [candidate division KSB1 bacterium]